MKEKFGPRTILIPLFSVIGFFAIQLSVYAVYIISLILASTFSGGVPDQNKLNDLFEKIPDVIISHSNYINAIFAVIIAIAAFFVIKALMRRNPLAVRTEKVRPGVFIASLMAMVGATGLVTLLMAGISELAKHVPVVKTAIDNYINMSEKFAGNGSIVMLVISTCILIPIAEDLVFRGIIQGEFRRVVPGWAAVVLQAVVFSLVHGNPIQISYVIIPALILGAAYEWSKSIYVPIAMHMVFNFIGAALPLMIKDNANAESYYVVAELAMIPVGIVAFLFIYSRRVKEPAAQTLDGQTDLTEPTGPTDLTGPTGPTDLTRPGNVSPVSSQPDDASTAWKHKDL
ncbi:MAG: CPBP family intramembrane glutamic endopeptidase [Saccharofermentanales bacterium]